MKNSSHLKIGDEDEPRLFFWGRPFAQPWLVSESAFVLRKFLFLVFLILVVSKPFSKDVVNPAMFSSVRLRFLLKNCLEHLTKISGELLNRDFIKFLEYHPS